MDSNRSTHAKPSQRTTLLHIPSQAKPALPAYKKSHWPGNVWARETGALTCGISARVAPCPCLGSGRQAREQSATMSTTSTVCLEAIARAGAELLLAPHLRIIATSTFLISPAASQTRRCKSIVRHTAQTAQARDTSYPHTQHRRTQARHTHANKRIHHTFSRAERHQRRDKQCHQRRTKQHTMRYRQNVGRGNQARAGCLRSGNVPFRFYSCQAIGSGVEKRLPWHHVAPQTSRAKTVQFQSRL